MIRAKYLASLPHEIEDATTTDQTDRIWQIVWELRALLGVVMVGIGIYRDVGI